MRSLKILHLSDTHGAHRRLLDLPEADVLVTHTPPYVILDKDGDVLYGSTELFHVLLLSKK